MGTGDLGTGFAGENLASSVIATNFFGIRDSLAVLSVDNVIPEGRSSGATTTYGPALNIPLHTARKKTLTALDIVLGVNTIMSFSAIGDTTHCLANGASRVVTPLLGKTLRATSVREGPTRALTLAVGRFTNTVGRVCPGGRSVAVIASKGHWMLQKGRALDG